MRNRRETPKERPIVIVRRKAGRGSAPPKPARFTPPAASPTSKPTTPAAPRPPLQPQPSAPLQPPTGSAPAEPGLNKKARERQARRELLAVLYTRWPRAFPRDSHQVRPLALGIRQDLAASLPEHPPGRIGFVIGLFQAFMRPAYLRAVVQGGPRYDLEGKPRGEVTLKEQEQAHRELQAYFEQRQPNGAPGAATPGQETGRAAVDKHRK